MYTVRMNNGFGEIFMESTTEWFGWALEKAADWMGAYESLHADTITIQNNRDGHTVITFKYDDSTGDWLPVSD